MIANQDEIKTLLHRIQQVTFKIICDIDEFCAKNNITYFLSGGTCLGAVRHNGFIPWDDDGDLMMPRKDYERFLKSFAEEYKEKYTVGSLFTDEKWQRPLAQISDIHSRIISTNLDYEPVGIHLDIFPIDGLPKNSIHRSFYYKKLAILNGLRNSSIRKQFLENEQHRWIKSLASSVTKHIGPRKFALMMDRYAARFDFETSDYVAASLPIHYGSRETIEKKNMASAVYLDFEGKQLPVPVGYDQYLHNLYDNYMEIPENAESNGYTHLASWIVEFDTDE